MSAAKQRDSAEPISLERAKVVHVDSEAPNRALLEDTLRDIGFSKIASCDNLGQFIVILGIEKPDLVFVDIDAEPDKAFQAIRDIRKGEAGENAFIVTVALTQKPELETVRAALNAGFDDMVVKPVTARALRQRVVNQIENRKEFIATDDYVGPDRRAENRELTEDDLASIKVPNSLRHAATGDESAAPSEERIRETLRNLSIQKFYHLSSKIGRVAGQQRDLLVSGAKSVDCGLAMQEISMALAEIDEIIGEQSFESVAQVVASTRQALVEVKACSGQVTPRHLELLCAHGRSIGVVLQESDESAGVLVSALEKAVSVVKANPCGPAAAKVDSRPEANAAARAGKPPSPAPQPAPPAAEPIKAPLKIRLKAWWDGVDPESTEAGADR
ncbi:MAG: response regulator [Proteobacteria bacterium]|nr:response regulator [Pseudomonadota bacterium]